MKDDDRERRFYAVRYEDDIPKTGHGTLIPYQKKTLTVRPKRSLIVSGTKAAVRLAAPLVSVAAVGFFVVSASFFGAETYARFNTAALPTVSIINPFTNETKPLHYGVQVALSQPNFFAETRDAFVDEEVTFVEVDLANRKLRYFKEGVLAEQMNIIDKGEVGSWWETPSGLYTLAQKDDNYYSSVGYVYLPWSLNFQGNFFIHGWPEYADGSSVPPEFRGGGIRLTTVDAQKLYELVDIDTPILVHERTQKEEEFVYEPSVPMITAPNYLVADIKSSTVLAGSDSNTVAPIASVTKLMTALIAAEYINLDATVSVAQPTFVQSLIPRLGERSRVSMYSLLQLLLVESSNEAAEVIASEVGRERFIELMNEKAKALGMESTVFADPSGLSPENISSLKDLLRLAQYIYESRSFIFEVTANQDLKTAYVGGEFGRLVNFNEVDELENFVGGKVGETIAAGQTSVTLHNLTVKGSERIVAIIILGSSSRNDDVTALYRYVEERFAR